MANRTEPVEGYKLIICNKIDEYLKSNKVSNKEFGEIFGVTEGAIRRWRTGIGALDINQIVKLCEYWKISIYELLDINDPSNLTEVEKERLNKIRENPVLADIIDNYSRK
jgi:transcriptional regulator with XRE-family HTH domain